MATSKDAKKKKDKKGASAASSSSEGTAPKYPDMALCQRLHRLKVFSRSKDAAATALSSATSTELQIQVFDEITTMKNPSLYQHLQHLLYGEATSSAGAVSAGSAAAGTGTATPPLVASAKLTADDLHSLELSNQIDWNALEEKLQTATESAGEMEVLDAKLEMARFAAARYTKDEALQKYQDVLDLPKLSGGKKLDAYMERARICSFYGDTAGTDLNLGAALKLSTESGTGDWDRRNRLKVYQALQHLLHRDLEKASKLLLDGVATFSCTEICTYNEFLVYAMLTNLLHLPRQQLKSKILDGPEILSVAQDKDIAAVLKLARALYDCDYKAYLYALLDVEPVLLADRYLHPHSHYWMRELHILAFAQFLDAYSSVTLPAMAQAFGVSVDFIDRYASRYIAANRLSAKIDKYGGVIVTNRPDEKNAQYRDMIQKGDLLLNRIQKLARVVDL